MQADRLTAANLEKLRANRARYAPDLTLTVPMVAIARQLKTRMSHAGAGSAFLKVAPREVAAFVTVVGVRAGVLQLSPHTAAARYALDRWLRSGGEKAVTAAAPQGVVRVKIV